MQTNILENSSQPILKRESSLISHLTSYAYKILKQISLLLNLSRPSKKFNIFDAIQFNENTYSSILEYLLKYRERNRFIFTEQFVYLLLKSLDNNSNNYFLKQLLSKSFVEIQDFEPTFIGREVYLETGRIDLLLSFPKIKILIENKLGAEFTFRQLDKYFDRFSKKNDNFVIILLCPKKERERYLNYVKDNMKIYKSENFLLLEHDTFIVEWLTHCCNVTKESKIKYYLEDLKCKLICLLEIGEKAMNEPVYLIKEFLEIEANDKKQDLFYTIKCILYASYLFAIEKFNNRLIELCKKIFAEDSYEIKGQINLHESYPRIDIINKRWSSKSDDFPILAIEGQKEIAELKIGFTKPKSLDFLPKWFERIIFTLNRETGILEKQDNYWLCYTTLCLDIFTSPNNNNLFVPNTLKSFGKLLNLLSDDKALNSLLFSIEEILIRIKLIIDKYTKEEVVSDR